MTEEQYTQVNNKLIQSLSSLRLSGEAHQILWAVITKTWSENKKYNGITLKELEQLTGLTSPQIIRSRKLLIHRKLIKIDKDPTSNMWVYEPSFLHLQYCQRTDDLNSQCCKGIDRDKETLTIKKKRLPVKFSTLKDKEQVKDKDKGKNIYKDATTDKDIKDIKTVKDIGSIKDSGSIDNIVNVETPSIDNIVNGKGANIDNNDNEKPKPKPKPKPKTMSAKDKKIAADFEIFWKYYPRKVDKKGAFNFYVTQIKLKKVDPAELLRASHNYAHVCTTKRSETCFILHARTFLGHRDLWKDYLNIHTGKIGQEKPKSRIQMLKEREEELENKKGEEHE